MKIIIALPNNSVLAVSIHNGTLPTQTQETQFEIFQSEVYGSLLSLVCLMTYPSSLRTCVLLLMPMAFCSEDST